MFPDWVFSPSGLLSHQPFYQMQTQHMQHLNSCGKCGMKLLADRRQGHMVRADGLLGTKCGHGGDGAWKQIQKYHAALASNSSLDVPDTVAAKDEDKKEAAS